MSHPVVIQFLFLSDPFQLISLWQFISSVWLPLASRVRTNCANASSPVGGKVQRITNVKCCQQSTVNSPLSLVWLQLIWNCTAAESHQHYGRQQLEHRAESFNCPKDEVREVFWKERDKTKMNSLCLNKKNKQQLHWCSWYGTKYCHKLLQVISCNKPDDDTTMTEQLLPIKLWSPNELGKPNNLE